MLFQNEMHKNCWWAFRFRLKSPVLPCDHYTFYFLHQLSRIFIDTILTEFFQYKFGGRVIGMNQVDIIKTIVSQYVDHQFISREIISTFKFCNDIMNGFESILLCCGYSPLRHRGYDEQDLP